MNSLTLKQISQKASQVDYFRLGQKIILAIVLFFAPFSVFADLATPPCISGLSCATSGGGAYDFILTIIKFVLAFAFLLAVVMLIYGGFRYIFSAGNEDATEAGKKTVINALIGIVIIILSFVIVQVVANTAGALPSGNPS